MSKKKRRKREQRRLEQERVNQARLDQMREKEQSSQREYNVSLHWDGVGRLSTRSMQLGQMLRKTNVGDIFPVDAIPEERTPHNMNKLSARIHAAAERIGLKVKTGRDKDNPYRILVEVIDEIGFTSPEPKPKPKSKPEPEPEPETESKQEPEWEKKIGYTPGSRYSTVLVHPDIDAPGNKLFWEVAAQLNSARIAAMEAEEKIGLAISDSRMDESPVALAAAIINTMWGASELAMNYWTVAYAAGDLARADEAKDA